MQKAITAVILNLLLPGVGYFYIKAKNRYAVAAPLLILAIYHLFIFFTDKGYNYPPGLSPFESTGIIRINVYTWLILLVVSIDTFIEATKKPTKNK